MRRSFVMGMIVAALCLPWLVYFNAPLASGLRGPSPTRSIDWRVDVHDAGTADVPRVIARPPLDPLSVTTTAGVWRETTPPQRYKHVACFDPVGRRMLFIGGQDDWFRNALYAIDADAPGEPTEVTVGGDPLPGLIDASIVYDSRRQRLLVFGGDKLDYYVGDLGVTNNVWEITLDAIPSGRLLTPQGERPLPRKGHAALYDPVRDRMVVYGGSDGADEVWALELSGLLRWVRLDPSGVAPAGRSGHGVLYDPEGDRMIVIGGGNGPTQIDVLEFAGGETWRILSAGGTPPTLGGSDAAMFDSNRRGVLVFGVDTGNETWELLLNDDSASWVPITVAGTKPGARYGHVATFDPVADRMMVHGGNVIPGPVFRDAWVLNLSGVPTWQQVCPVDPIPSERYLPAFAEDSNRNRLLMFGGWAGLPPAFNDLWALSFAAHPSWSALAPGGTKPSARFGASMIYESEGDRIILFGGATPAKLNDVWSLPLAGSSAWSRLFPSGSAPVARYAHTAVYDAARRRMVVFGGSSDGGYKNDVYVLNLSGVVSWAPLATQGVAPSARFEHGAVFDAASDRMLVFGGYDGTSLQDAWALDFATTTPTWTQLADLPIRARRGPLVALDSPRRQVLLFGGASASSYGFDVQALDLEGAQSWSQLAPFGYPAMPRRNAVAAFDQESRRFVVSSGVTGSARNDTWTLDWTPPSRPTYCSAADQVVEYQAGPGTNLGSRQSCLLDSDGIGLSLGTGGSVTVRLASNVIDGRGDDLIVYELGADDGDVDEEFLVEVGSTQSSFVTLGSGSGGAVAFDLGASGLTRARYVRITDTGPASADPYRAGVDLDAIEVLNCGKLDFALNRIEVAQAVVSERLVQGKPTVVRAFLENTGDPAQDWTPVQGQLHVLDGNGTQLYIRDAAEPLVWPVDDSFDHESERKGTNSLNFYLTAEETRVSSLRFWADIDPNNLVTEEDELNNDNAGAPVSQSFYLARSLDIGYCVVGPYWQREGLSVIGSAPALLSKTYPTVFDPVSNWQDAGFVSWPVTVTSYNVFALLHRLKIKLGHENDDRRKIGDPELSALIGFSTAWDMGDVVGKTGGQIIAVDAGYVQGMQHILAHEIGHGYGLRGEYYSPIEDPPGWRAEDNYPLDISGCPDPLTQCRNYPARNRNQGLVQGRYVSIGSFDVEAKRPAGWGSTNRSCESHPERCNLAIDHATQVSNHANLSQVLHWDGWADAVLAVNDRRIGFMGSATYGDGFAWITDDDYEVLADHFIISGPSKPAPSTALVPTSGDLLQLWMGTVITATDQVIPFAWRIIETEIIPDSLQGTQYSLALLDAGSGVLASYGFDLDFSAGDSVLFAPALPFPTGVTEVRISKGAQLLYSRVLSASPPEVTILTPLGGETPAESLTVSWSVSDTDGDDIVADVFLSLNGGASWSLFAAEYPETTLTLAMSDLPGTSQAKVRISVTDGMRVTSADSPGTFTIGAKTPIAIVLTPGDSTEVLQSDMIQLTGDATDPEDGMLPDSLLVWTDPVAGALGIGRHLSVSAGSPGMRTIILTTNDFESNTARDTCRVTVLADVDGDGMSDAWEVMYPGLDPTVFDGQLDLDHDRLSNRDEYRIGTDPTDMDTDGDGAQDGLEVEQSTDPLDPSETPVGVTEVPPRPVLSLMAYPNPFRGYARIRYVIPLSSTATIDVFDIRGRRLVCLAQGQHSPGEHEVRWDGRDDAGRLVSSGIYFYRCRNAGKSVVLKAVFLR